MATPGILEQGAGRHSPGFCGLIQLGQASSFRYVLHGNVRRRMRFGTRRQAKDEVMDWIVFYNHRRLHSTLGYASPMAFEQKWLARQISLAA